MIRKALMAASAGVLVVTASLSAQNRTPERPPRVSTAVEPGLGAQIPKPTGKNAIRLMTYNVENWNHTFLPRAVLATTRPGLPDDVVEVLKNADKKKDEELWEVARTVIDVQPDIWVMQEGCKAADLNYFNTQFLGGYFETVHVFATNTERDQNTGILIRPGFKVLEFREDYHNEPDKDHVNPLFDKLFARGPGFALIQAPDGTKFWVGTNHEKSKSGNSVEVTKWRNAEGRRVNEIINELSDKGPKQVFFLGDMNDELGYQEYEQEAGGSGTDLIAGKGKGELTVLTKKLAESGAISFGGYRRSQYRSFIDHAFATPEAAKWVTNVSVFRGDLADVASDHYPVYVDVNVP
jgi:endonuclease/exonuclease/phosphatase family metal-dependent hydrolase